MTFRTGSWSAQLNPQAAHPTSDSPSPSRAQVLFSAAPKLQLPRARPRSGGTQEPAGEPATGTGSPRKPLPRGRGHPEGQPGWLAEGSLECSGLGAPAQLFPSLGLSLSMQKQLLARLKGGQPHPVCSDRASKCPGSRE